MLNDKSFSLHSSSSNRAKRYKPRKQKKSRPRKEKKFHKFEAMESVFTQRHTQTETEYTVLFPFFLAVRSKRWKTNRLGATVVKAALSAFVLFRHCITTRKKSDEQIRTKASIHTSNPLPFLPLQRKHRPASRFMQQWRVCLDPVKKHHFKQQKRKEKDSNA